jgi:histidyl-tRNA synthetase
MKNIIQPVKGTRDYYPEAMAVRSWLYATARKVAESFGYQEYEAPFLESIDLYAAKSGEELVKEQSYAFKDRGGNLITLRPELTPSLARMIAQRQSQLTFPLRWWSFGPFWRYERPQKGRSREFFQWNVDLIGAADPAADAEVVAVLATFFREVGLKPQDTLIMVNSRQLVENELGQLGISASNLRSVFRLVDRKEKMGQADWESYAAQLGLSTTQINGLEKLLSNDKLWEMSPELCRFFPAAEALGVQDYVRFAPNIIRGLDHYTGIVFEAQAVRSDLRRSLLGGGRYDNLLADVGGEALPATGYAMGDLAISIFLEELDLIPKDLAGPPTPVMVTVFDRDRLLDTLALAAELRRAGLNITSYPGEEKLAKQLKYADRLGFRFVIMRGPDEIARDEVTIKDLVSREQFSVPRSAAASAIRKRLDNPVPS